MMGSFCHGCGEPCREGLCIKCVSKLPFSIHLQTPRQKNVDETCAVFLFEPPVTNWIHKLKFQGDLRFAGLFSRLMWEHLTLSDRIECIIPVPQHPNKTKKRGFNQALSIANGLSKKINRPVRSDLVFRVKDTPSQRGKKEGERSENVLNAFGVNACAKKVRGALIIDDVLTTGSTVRAVAGKLKQQNPNIFIQLWVLAKT